jgi:SecD/SecF fusion protein
VRAERQPGGEEAQTAAVEKIRAAVGEIAPGAMIERTEVVGPKVSGELAYAGFLSVFLASLAMLFYIWFRFEWPFAVGAIATLILDVTKVVGFFALAGLDFNLTAIAALLTLIGYSVNDKSRGLRPHAREQPMVVGIVIAATSSVFISAPILLFLGDWRTRRRAAAPREPVASGAKI